MEGQTIARADLDTTAMPLITTDHFDAADAVYTADDFYEALIDAHRDLALAQSHELNAKLVLLLANHVGDGAVLREALALARQSVATPPDA